MFHAPWPSGYHTKIETSMVRIQVWYRDQIKPKQLKVGAVFAS